MSFKRAGELALLTLGLIGLFIVTGAPTGGGSGGGITACSGDINAACSQVTSGAHLGAGTVPNASLVTAPVTACSGDINAGCSQVTSGAHLGAGTVPNASLVTAPVTACSGDINAGCSAVSKTNGVSFATSATTDTTNATNISTGTLAAARGGAGVGTYGGFVQNCASNVAHSITSNTIKEAGFTAQGPFVLTSGGGLFVNLGAGDASNNTDFGIYYCATPGSGNCTLIEDVGAAHYSSTGQQTIAWMTNAACTANVTPGGLCTGNGTGTYPPLPVTEPPGDYVEAATSVAGTLTMNVCGNATNDIAWIAGTNGTGTTSGGVLPTTITSPALAMGATATGRAMIGIH